MYIKTIGLEIHIKLLSDTKLFCSCANIQNFDTLVPNTYVCPVCSAQPGGLPVLMKGVLLKGLLLGKVLTCTIQDQSSFDRKSYFYPDLPLGYQITQYYNPTCVNGKVLFWSEDFEKEYEVHIRQAHMETDTAKMIHDGGQALIDFNRAGTPLVEVVTGPDFTHEDQVIAFLKELQRMVRWNSISDADMEKGQMRVDVNISIRRSVNEEYGTRVELKNINSFASIRNAIIHEYQRQISLVQAGKSVDQETRMWDDVAGKSQVMRSKDDALDYRYAQDPDLPVLEVDHTLRAELDQYDVKIPSAMIRIWRQEYGFHKEYINVLLQDTDIISYVQVFWGQGIVAKLVMKWVAGPIMAYLKENLVSIEQLPFTQQQFHDFLYIAQEGKLPDNQLKIVMDEMLQTGADPQQLIKDKGFGNDILESDALATIVQEVLQQHGSVVDQYRAGKESVIGFLVGQVMRQTAGKAHPEKVQEEIRQQLS